MFLTVISEIEFDQQITQHDLQSPGGAVKAHLSTLGLAPFYDAGYDDNDLARISEMINSDVDRGFVVDHSLQSVWIWTTNAIFPDLPTPLSITVVRTERT